MIRQIYGSCAGRLSRKRRKSHQNDENDKDNSDSYKQGVEWWIRGNHGNHENDENHGNPGCKPRVPQTTGLDIPHTYMSHTHTHGAQRKTLND